MTKLKNLSGNTFEKKCIKKLIKNCKILKKEKNFMSGFFISEECLKFTLTFKSWFFKLFEDSSIKPHGCKEPDSFNF